MTEEDKAVFARSKARSCGGVHKMGDAVSACKGARVAALKMERMAVQRARQRREVKNMGLGKRQADVDRALGNLRQGTAAAARKTWNDEIEIVVL